MRANLPVEIGRGPSARRDVVGILARILPLAAGVGRAARLLGLVGLGAAAAIALVVALRWRPGDGEAWAGFAILCLLLAVPAAVLFSFSFVLGEVVELPDKLRGYPGLTRERSAELRTIAREAAASERPAWRRLPGSTWRLATLERSARELLAPHAPLLPLLNVWFLLATAAAALLVTFIGLAALVVLLAAVA